MCDKKILVQNKYKSIKENKGRLTGNHQELSKQEQIIRRSLNTRNDKSSQHLKTDHKRSLSDLLPTTSLELSQPLDVVKWVSPKVTFGRIIYTQLYPH